MLCNTTPRDTPVYCACPAAALPHSQPARRQGKTMARQGYLTHFIPHHPLPPRTPYHNTTLHTPAAQHQRHASPHPALPPHPKRDSPRITKWARSHGNQIQTKGGWVRGRDDARKGVHTPSRRSRGTDRRGGRWWGARTHPGVHYTRGARFGSERGSAVWGRTQARGAQTGTVVVWGGNATREGEGRSSNVWGDATGRQARGTCHAMPRGNRGRRGEPCGETPQPELIA